MPQAWLLIFSPLLAVATTLVVGFSRTRTPGDRPSWRHTVIPIIFAVSVLLFWRTLGEFSRWEWLQRFAQQTRPDQPTGALLQGFLIVVFSYLYASRSTGSTRRF